MAVLFNNRWARSITALVVGIVAGFAGIWLAFGAEADEPARRDIGGAVVSGVIVGLLLFLAEEAREDTRQKRMKQDHGELVTLQESQIRAITDLVVEQRALDVEGRRFARRQEYLAALQLQYLRNAMPVVLRFRGVLGQYIAAPSVAGVKAATGQLHGRLAEEVAGVRGLAVLVDEPRIASAADAIIWLVSDFSDLWQSGDTKGLQEFQSSFETLEATLKEEFDVLRDRMQSDI